MNSVPQITEASGIYTYDFNDEQIGIKVHRLHETSESLTAELDIYTTDPMIGEFIHSSRLNLLNINARTSISKQCASRRNHADWGAIVESVCVSTIRAHRKGQPLIEIGELPKNDQPKYQLYPVIVKDQPNLIFADGGTGKSYLATLFALLVQSGESRLGLEPTQGTVLYLDFETDKTEINDRMRALSSGLSLDGTQILYRRCYQPLADDIDALKALIEDHHKPDMIIIDSVMAACGGEPEKALAVGRYFMALRSMECTTLSIDHVQKNTENPSPFGSAYKRNIVRNMWHVRKFSEEGAPNMSLALFHKKVNSGGFFKPIGFTFNFSTGDDDVIFVDTIDVADVPELAKGLSQPQQVYVLLQKTGPLKVQEIADSTMIDAASVRTVLNRGKGSKFVELMDGKWGICRRD